MNGPGAKVLVVGAGMAGLAAALRLRDAGVDVTVVDPAGAGGKAGSLEPAPGWRIETGPHTFTHRAEPVFRFAERLGMADRLVLGGKAASARYLVRGGRLLRGSPFSGLLSLGEWASVAAGFFRTGSVDGTVADWLRRTFGERIAAGPGGAATVGIWAARPEEIEFASGFPVLAAALEQHGSLFRVARAAAPAVRAKGTWGFPGGIGELVAEAARAVGGVQRQRVFGLTPTAGGGWNAVGVGIFDRVIVAAEAPSAARLFRDWPDVSGELGAVATSPILAVHWTAPDAAFPAGFGYLSPPSEGREVLGTLFTSDVHPERAPAGERSFCTLVGGTPRPDRVGMDAQEAEACVRAEHLALTGQPVRLSRVHLVRHPHAVALPGPGHRDRVRRIQAALPAGLELAGSWMGTGAVPDALASGEAAADRVLAAKGRVRDVA